MVHIRRGDYQDLPNYGILSGEYFTNSISNLCKRGLITSNVCWIFSDDIESVKSEFSKLDIPGFIFDFIVEPEGVDAAEVLKLMTYGQGNIISNSTFSWWAAFLNGDGAVVAPSVWMKNPPELMEILPKNWVIEESVWK